MGEQDLRLKERAAEAFRAGRRGRTIVLAAVASIVVVNTMADALASYNLLLDNIPSYRAWLVVSMGLTGVINIVLVMLVWIIFDTLSRVERESDRLQVFMDNMYRRGMR